MYTVALIAREGYEIKSTNEKSISTALETFILWLKKDAFNGEMMLLWDNDNLMKQIDVRKKTDWRMGEVFQDVNDDTLSKDARKYHKRIGYLHLINPHHNFLTSKTNQYVQKTKF